jgi:hypothetical protein
LLPNNKPAVANDGGLFLCGNYKKLCGSTSTSSFKLPEIFGAAANHCRK